MTPEAEKAVRDILTVIVAKVETELVSSKTGPENGAITVGFRQHGSEFEKGIIFQEKAIEVTIKKVSMYFKRPESEICVGSARSIPPTELAKRLWVFNQPIFESVFKETYGQK